MISRLYETDLKSQPMKRELHVCKKKKPKTIFRVVSTFTFKSAIIRYCAYLFFVVCNSLQNVHVDG